MEVIDSVVHFLACFSPKPFVVAILEMIDGAPINFCLCPEMMQFMKDEDFLGSSKLMYRDTFQL